MKYPERISTGQWYFEITPNVQTSSYGAGKFVQVEVTVAIQGKTGTCSFRQINLKSETVEKELTEAITVAKKVVDILNGGKGGGPVVPLTGTCAKCSGPCPEDDYLCKACRSSTTS